MADQTSTKMPSTPQRNLPPSKNIQRANDTPRKAQRVYKDAAEAMADWHSMKLPPGFKDRPRIHRPGYRSGVSAR